MSLPRHLQYHACDDSFLREHPAHWILVRADSVLTTSRRIVQPADMAGQQVYHYSIPVLQDTGAGQLEDGSTIDSAKTLIQERCVLVSKLNPRKGTVCIAAPQAGDLTVGSGELIPLIPRDGLVEYVHYVVQSLTYRDRLASLVESATRSHQRASVDDVLKFTWAFPPREEQHCIVSLLDRETAKIDTLIAEKERLIALLREKRQAVISHLLTKGLDPNVPMKDSQVEWIGDVPRHWNIARTGRVFRRIGSGSTPQSDNASYYDDSGVEWVNTGDLPDGPINAVARRVSREAISKFTTLREYPAGAIVIAMYGATIGKLGILTRPAVVNQACCVLSDGDGVAEPFLFYALLAAREAIVRLATGGTQPNISQATVRAFPIPVPPLEEQSVIIAALETRLEKLEALTNDAELMVVLLRERRTALITAAVTGQIDARRLVETAA